MFEGACPIHGSIFIPKQFSCSHKLGIDPASASPAHPPHEMEVFVCRDALDFCSDEFVDLLSTFSLMIADWLSLIVPVLKVDNKSTTLLMIMKNPVHHDGASTLTKNSISYGVCKERVD